MQTAKELKELIDQLPPEFQEEVRDFVEFLLERKARKRGRKLRQDWAGALEALPDLGFCKKGG
jgi:mRNA-degrading endonuclease RelE of RelBE toxin-antitoxin system